MRALGAEILGVDERLKCCPLFECVVSPSLSSLNTYKAEKSKSSFHARLPDHGLCLIVPWDHTEAEGEGKGV